MKPEDLLLLSLFTQGTRPRIPSIFEDFGKPVEETMSIRETAQAQLERLEAERQRLLTRLDIIDQFGEEDPWKDEAVLFFKRDFGGPRSYTHIAVKLADKWYVTGERNANRAFTWPELVEEHLAKSLPGSLYVADSGDRYMMIWWWLDPAPPPAHTGHVHNDGSTSHV